jgi:hypothetical protein
MKSDQIKNDHFQIDEVVEIKGFLFKIVLVDAFTGKIGLKQVSPAEAKSLKVITKP